MYSPELVLSRRLTKTPFEQRVFENGVKGLTIYNHRPLASYFSSPQEDYEHLCRHVQIWDVSCERQVEVVGADAMRLVELVTPRDISKCEIGQCMYAPLVDEHGGIVNDPIIIRLAKDRLWVSIADSGVLLWLKGIVYGRGYNVSVFEPDVSPLAIQGPKSDDLLADVVGDHIREIKRFWFIEAELAETDVIIARSGWSGQGGFEIYLTDRAKGLALWDLIWDAGRKYNIRAGCPNIIDRIERGLLSYGSDMTMDNNPYECGLERFFEARKDAESMSKDALAKFAKNGVRKNQVYLAISGSPMASPRSIWDVVDENNKVVGMVTSSAYSRNYQSNVAFALVDAEVNQEGRKFRVDIGAAEPGESAREATIVVKRGEKLETLTNAAHVDA
ncbi:dimethylsulfoniopropionate demethylase [Candidatus Spongiihabitans sp.]|uniref:dimethylsulfoniopropionate demethylase n=1 Tax=Candidatus Spongiihabitans sp. TaxID=3101308 RepID=UPI003C79DEF7